MLGLACKSCGLTSGLVWLCHFESQQQFLRGESGSPRSTHHKTRMSL